MSQPNLTPVDERLRADLARAMQRDPNVVRNADHLYGLLVEVAPDMPGELRSACVAVARTNATSWLTQTPPYSEEQVVAWLRAQFPDITPDAARQALAAFAALTGARGTGPVPPAQQSPVFDQPTVAGAVGQLAGPPTSQPPFGAPTVFPGYQPAAPQYQQPAWSPPPPPPGPTSSTSKPRRPLPLIIALVAVLVLAGAGVGAYFLFKKDSGGSGSEQLSAPTHVTAMSHEGDSVMVSWQPVPGADHYVVTDTSGGLAPTTVHGTVSIFDHAAGADHRFVVQAYAADGSAGEKSAAAMWMKAAPPAAPANLTATREGYRVRLIWDAVTGADGYQVRDTKDPSFTPGIVHGTSYVVPDASLTAHSYTVSAIRSGQAGAAATVEFRPKNTLTAGEATLAYRLQSNTVVPGSCTSLDAKAGRYVTASISCKPVGARLHKPTELFVFQLKHGTQNAYERARFSNITARQNYCGDGPDYPAQGTHGQWFVKGDPKPWGDTYCFISSDNYAVYDWTYYRDDIVLEALGRGATTRTGLYNWWHGTPVELR